MKAEICSLQAAAVLLFLKEKMEINLSILGYSSWWFVPSQSWGLNSEWIHSSLCRWYSSCMFGSVCILLAVCCATASPFMAARWLYCCNMGKQYLRSPVVDLRFYLSIHIKTNKKPLLLLQRGCSWIIRQEMVAEKKVRKCKRTVGKVDMLL